jgi:serine-type D-Ala-D-Ala carboxypeptidase/endopeptidase
LIRRFFPASLALLLLWGPHWASAQGRLDHAAIKSILEERIDTARRGVGIVVGVIDADGRQIVSYGKMSRGSDREPDGDTAFEIGSITKVFTSVLLADMAGRGELALDDPVAEFLPESVQVPGTEGRPITLRDLAIHRSGLPRLPGNLVPVDAGNPYADYTIEQMYRFLDGYQLPRDVGAQFEYSNLGVGLLGHALALRAGVDYEALFIERIADPLGLADTRIALSADLQSRLATGHDFGGRWVANWDLPTLAGAGALRSTANNLLDFLEANMGLGESSLAAALEVTHVRQANAGSTNMDIGLGWFILNAAGNQILWHDGGTGGYRTFAGFDKNRQFGVVVLSNSANSVTDIGLHLFDGAFPLASLQPLPEVVELDPAVLDAYVGEYELVPNFILTVSKENDQLFVQATGQDKAEVFPASETRFFYTIVEAQITFVKDESGQVMHLTLHQGGFDQDARKLPSPTAVLERFTDALPEDPGLDPNYPNPFNSSTVIPFALSEAAEVDLGVYNLGGQQVATLAAGWRRAGEYALYWDGRDDSGRGLASGIYVYRLRIGGAKVATRKLTLIR